MKILIVSHPRSGTGFAAMCLQDIGLKVGHERVLENGISSWLWGADCFTNARWGDNYSDIKPDVTIMLARDPEAVIASMAFTAARAFDWMRLWVDIPRTDPVIMAGHSLIRWMELCKVNRYPDYIVRTEDFIDFCQYKFSKRPSKELIGYNTRKHLQLSPAQKEIALPFVEKYWKIVTPLWLSNRELTEPCES